MFYWAAIVALYQVQKGFESWAADSKPHEFWRSQEDRSASKDAFRIRLLLLRSWNKSRLE